MSAFLRRTRPSLTVHRVSLFFGNTLYLAAFGYYAVITFYGYNGTACLINPNY
jgi:hypothetical protein